MKYQDLQSNLSSQNLKQLGILHQVDQADQQLPEPAAHAINSFVGMGPGAAHAGVKFGIMQSRQLEDAYSDNPSPKGKQIRQQLEQAFSHIRKILENKHGSHILLFRAQPSLDSIQQSRNTLSFTSDWLVALQMLGIDLRFLNLKPISDQKINQALREYQNQGRVKFQKYLYVRTDIPTHDPQLDEYYYDIYDDQGEHITDGDNIQQELKTIQQDRQQLLDKIQVKLKQIRTKSVAIKDIIWITDRALQSEFIVNNHPSLPHYLPPHK
jgi:hypothetical protein